MPSRIWSSVTSTTSSTNRRLRAYEYGSHRGAPSESAIVRTASMDCGAPAAKLRDIVSAPSGSTTNTAVPGLSCFTAQATPPVRPPPPAATITASSSVLVART
ncbi:MAG: hypothetical protein U5K74_12135 [Gemmatimonadaceae bacterium]|nr:hypothetical protein [Gemmatimonadaceae bacterium]